MITLADILTQIYLPPRLGLAPGTVQQLAIAVRLLDRWLGRPSRLDDLSTVALCDWMRWLAKDRAPRTVNAKRQAILTLWRAAVEEGLCEPPRKWPPKWPEPRRVPNAFTIEQFGQLLRACDSLKGEWDGCPVRLAWRTFLLFVWDTGVRLAAILAGRVQDVDIERGLWYVSAEHIKGRQADRVFRLHPDTLQVFVDSLRSPRELIFPFPFCRHQFWYHLKRLCRAAGLPDGRQWLTHCIRRSTESYAAAARGVEWAAAAVGHSVQVAKDSYICPSIAPGPSLVDAVPRPEL